MKEKREESFARTMYDSAENLWQVGL